MRLSVRAVEGIGEVRAGADLVAVVAASAELSDGDVVVVTSKVVSKAEDRVHRGDRVAAVRAETDRVLARRGETLVVRNHLGLVMAAAGVDASNTSPGTVVLLPRDPDGSARALRHGLAMRTGVNVAVVVSDTSGRAWRNGQTDIAVGVAGMPALVDLAGSSDGYGNTLAVTAPALADELAGAADLVSGKTRQAPVAVVSGLAHLVLPAGEDGAGAGSLVRDERSDLFGLGAREAVLAALVPDPVSARGFGATAPAAELAAALTLVAPGAEVQVGASGCEIQVSLAAVDEREAGRVEARLRAVAQAHQWALTGGGGPLMEDAAGAASADTVRLRLLPTPHRAGP